MMRRHTGTCGAFIERFLAIAFEHQVGGAPSRLRYSNGQAEFRLLSLCRRERRQGDTQKPNASHDGKKRFEQGVAELSQLASRLDRQLTGAAECDDPKVGELDLERDGAAAY